MSDVRKKLGSSGEELAVDFLRRQGYRILARNWRCPLGEIDLVAKAGSTLVFCEVKARRTTEFGRPFEAISAAKQHRLRQLADYYLSFIHKKPAPARFDVISILLTDGKPSIEHIRDAF